MQQKAQTTTPNKNHQNIPGNPSTAISSPIRLNDRSNGEPLRLLTDEDWKFWIQNGYVIIKNAVPKENAKRLADYLWEYEGKDPDDIASWYSRPNAPIGMEELTNTGMVEIYQHQYLWDNRQYPKVHQAFADIWGTEKLWVSIDRANLNFPVRKGFEHSGFIHWDYDPESDEPHVQGVLALADQMDEQMGGFQCVPELYRTYDSWKHTQPENRDPYKPDTKGFEILKIGLETGDLLIFNSKLPHGIRPNKSKNKVRIAQYISMMPAREDDQELLQWRINSWKNKVAPEGFAFPGDPLQREKHDPIAQLTELGEKLLGLKKW
ncbi:MAG TPA: phytanoyl-CoA dioxygenase family protein [Cyclobacteriaceae bacterium]|nr:phytanoyl-CoA dioxygenase family protein [Cyclobacteriaceae bacterium]